MKQKQAQFSDPAEDDSSSTMSIFGYTVLDLVVPTIKHAVAVIMGQQDNSDRRDNNESDDNHHCNVNDALPDITTTSSVTSSSSPGIQEDVPLAIYSLQEVSLHDSPSDCWLVLYDYIYSLGAFLQAHPGGDDVLLEYAGRDATLAFRGVGHSAGAVAALQPFLVGQLPQNQRICLSGEPGKGW